MYVCMNEMNDDIYVCLYLCLSESLNDKGDDGRAFVVIVLLGTKFSD
jgi:hypothetical protein